MICTYTGSKNEGPLRGMQKKKKNEIDRSCTLIVGQIIYPLYHSHNIRCNLWGEIVEETISSQKII